MPDNDVDESFLKDLQTNVNLRTYNKLDAIIETGVVTQEISSVVTFVVIFVYMDNKVLLPNTLLVNSTLLLLMMYFLYKFVKCRYDIQNYKRTGMDDIKSVIFFVCFTFGLSPVLQTLTHTISTDTIYATVTLMMLVHLLFHDYGPSAPIVSSSISLNAAIFSSVCLASRLPTAEDAFVLLTFAVEVFALFPVFRRHFQKVRKASILMTTVMFATSSSGLLTITSTGTILFILVIVFVNLICPIWFVNWQTCKNNIYGPWDEAVVEASEKET